MRIVHLRPGGFVRVGDVLALLTPDLAGDDELIRAVTAALPG